MPCCLEETALQPLSALAALDGGTAIERSTDQSALSQGRCRDAPSVQCSLPIQVYHLFLHVPLPHIWLLTRPDHPERSSAIAFG